MKAGRRLLHDLISQSVSLRAVCTSCTDRNDTRYAVAAFSLTISPESAVFDTFESLTTKLPLGPSACPPPTAMP